MIDSVTSGSFSGEMLLTERNDAQITERGAERALLGKAAGTQNWACSDVIAQQIESSDRTCFTELTTALHAKRAG